MSESIKLSRSHATQLGLVRLGLMKTREEKGDQAWARMVGIELTDAIRLRYNPAWSRLGNRIIQELSPSLSEIMEDPSIAKSFIQGYRDYLAGKTS